MRFLALGLSGCATAYVVGAGTGRPTVGGLAGTLTVIAADRAFGKGGGAEAGPRRPLPAWLTTAISVLPVIGFAFITDGFDGVVGTAPDSGWRALVLTALVLVYVVGIQRSPQAEEKAPPPDVRDAPGAVQREIDAATRGR